MYDLIIIWAWSAGLPAGIYASRYKIKNIIIWEMLGGALTQAHQVENYPGYEKISGFELMDKFLNQAKLAGSEIIHDRVVWVRKDQDLFEVTTQWWKIIKSKYVLIAIWNKYRKLNIMWETEFIWKWVSYCATCDGMFYRNREVAVVGGGNTALTETLYLAELCAKVYLIHRRWEFRWDKVLVERILSNPKIEVIYNDEIVNISGTQFVEETTLKSWNILKVEWVFVAIWNEPDTSLFDDLWVNKDDYWYIRTNPLQQTSVVGLYAAGDITTNSNKFQQSLTSAAEWAIAVSSIHEDILKK